MRYTLLVLTAPDMGSSPRHALRFAQAADAAGHTIDCVFFFDAGVLTALAGCEGSQDEDDLRGEWTQLHNALGAPLLACVASAARFGIGEDPGRLQPGFTIAGLGELIESTRSCDRFLTFAG